MANALFLKVVLDTPRQIRFRPGVFRYRAGEIRHFVLDLAKGLKSSRTFERALCQWLYCVLDEDCELDSPEAIADAIAEKSVDEKVAIATTLIDCINLYKPAAESKNGSGSTPSPSPTSS